MANEDKRIIEQTATESIYNDDWFLKDSPTQGTTKIQGSKLKERFQEGIAADGVTYDNTSSGLESTNVNDAIDEVQSNVESLDDNKADKDGIYDSLVAGNIISDSYEVDNAPYNYRASHIGSALDLSVVGGTIAWNQLVQNGNFASSSGWSAETGVTLSCENNVATISSSTASNGILKSIPSIKDHVYITMAEVNSPSAYNDVTVGNTTNTGGYAIVNISQSDVNKWIPLTHVGKSTASSNGAPFYFFIRSAYENVKLRNVMLIDLTQTFGSTIADYIYSLEQATSGSGIAWLKSYGFLTKNYYAYDSGSLQSVNVSSRKIVGKNLFDKSNANVLNAYIASGSIIANSNHKSVYIPCTPNTTYTVQKIAVTSGSQDRFSVGYTTEVPVNGGTCYGILSNNSFVEGQKTSLTITTGADARYLIIWISFVDKYTESINTFQIELGSIATSYEPYKKVSYPLDSSLTLRGIPKKDANNNLYYDGDVYNADGSVKRRYGVVDLGQQTWYYKESGTSVAPYFYFDCTSLGIKYIGTFGTTVHNIRCAKYVAVEKSYANFVDKTMCADGGGNAVTQIQIKDASYNGDASAFKTAMSGVYLLFEKATPTTESAQPFTNPQQVFSGGTEEFVDAGTSASTPTRDVDIPCGQDSKYYLDIKGKVEQLYGIPDVPSANGTYTLKATRSASGVTYSWVSG